MSEFAKGLKNETEKQNQPGKDKIPSGETKEKLAQQSRLVGPPIVETSVSPTSNKIEVVIETADELYQGLLLLSKIMWGRIEKGNPPNMEQIRGIAMKIVGSYAILDELLAVMTRTHIYVENYLPIHTVNVAILSVYFGLALDYDYSDIVDLAITGLLHDIGMINVPREILLKHGKLTPEEFKEIRKHTMQGAEMIKELEGINECILEGVRFHHERENGAGYNGKKKDEHNSEFGKVIALADMYEALTHPRIYKKALPPAEAMKQILSQGREIFSENLLKLMTNHFFFYPPGSLVQLNTGEIGRVRKVHPNFPTQPTLEIVKDKEGKMPRDPRIVDLLQEKMLSIARSLTETDLLELIDEESKRKEQK